MPAPTIPYAVATIDDLKALTAENRADGYTKLARSVAAWYTFVAASTANGDDDLVLMPNDNPSTGRFLKTGAPLYSWVVITSDNPSIQRLDIYYKNISESAFDATATIAMTVEDKIGTFTSNMDYTPGQGLGISSLAKENGSGFYFFVYLVLDGSGNPSVLSDPIVVSAITSQPKGAARIAHAVKEVAVAEGIASQNLGLVVTQSTSVCTFTADQIPEPQSN